MKNKFLKVSLPLITLGSATLLATPILVNNKNDNYEYESNNARIFDDNSQYKEISLNFDVRMYSPNSLAIVPGGYFIPTSSGAKLVDNNFKEIWTWDKTNIQIYDATYVPETSSQGNSNGSILVTSKNNEKDKVITVSLIDIKTGVVFSENDIDLSNFNDYHQDVVNNSDLFMLTKVHGVTGQYIFTSKSKLYYQNTERNKSTFLIKLNENSIESIENISLFETEDNGYDTILFSMTAVNINGDIYALSLQNYVTNDTSRVFLMLTKMNNDTAEEIASQEIQSLKGDKNNEDEAFSPNNFIIPTFSINKINDDFSFSIIANLSKTRNLIIVGSFDETKIDIDREISLVYGFGDNDNPNQNYNIKWGYYSESLNCWVTYSTIKNKNTTFGSIVLFNLDNIYRSNDFSIYNEYNVIAFTDNQGPLKDGGNFIPFAPLETSSINIEKNINVINTGQETNNVSLSTNNKIYTYDYSNLSLKTRKIWLEFLLGCVFVIGGASLVIIATYNLLKHKKEE